ncbi:MAG: protein-disulfide reductase DsbD domain-containing protein, partial [bacterium]
MRKLAFAGLICLLLPLISSTQVLEPVKWSFQMEQTGPDEATLLLIARIDKGWHLYSQHIPDGGPRPTIFTFHQNDSYSLIGGVTEPKGVEEYDPNFEINLKFFSGTVFFKQKIKLLATNPFTITGTLEFMCCDDKRCLPPTVVDFTFKLPAAQKPVTGTKSEAAAPVKEVAQDTATQARVDTIKVVPVPEAKNESLWVFFV